VRTHPRSSSRPAARSRPPFPVPVRLQIRIDERLPEPVELATHYVVAEVLTNAAKHADASVIDIAMEVGGGVLHLSSSTSRLSCANAGRCVRKAVIGRVRPAGGVVHGLAEGALDRLAGGGHRADVVAVTWVTKNE
jgi:hypothetical protein